jgi:hypothetical protein
MTPCQDLSKFVTPVLKAPISIRPSPTSPSKAPAIRKSTPTRRANQKNLDDTYANQRKPHSEYTHHLYPSIGLYGKGADSMQKRAVAIIQYNRKEVIAEE